MGATASEITCLAIVYSDFYSGADQRKHKSSASLAFAGNSPATGAFPAQVASNSENVSIWWRHHINNGDAYHYVPITRAMRGPRWTPREDRLIAYRMIRIYDTYDAYDVTGRGPDGPCDQISAGY